MSQPWHAFPHLDYPGTPEEIVRWLVRAIDEWPDPRESEAYRRAVDWLSLQDRSEEAA